MKEKTFKVVYIFSNDCPLKRLEFIVSSVSSEDAEVFCKGFVFSYLDKIISTGVSLADS